MLGALNWTVEWIDPAKAGKPGNYGPAELTGVLQRLLLDELLFAPGPDAPGPVAPGAK